MPSQSGANQGEPESLPGRPRPVGNLLVRLPQPSDAQRLAVVNMVTWQTAYAGIVPDAHLEAMDIDTMIHRWRARIAKPPKGPTCLVAEVDGVIASYAIGGAYRTQQDAKPEDTTGWGELFAIYTHPDLQGRGAGRAVHDAVLTTLRDDGFSTAALWMLRDNVATSRWYAAHGWRPDGATSGWLGAGIALQEVRLTRSLSAAECEFERRLV